MHDNAGMHDLTANLITLSRQNLSDPFVHLPNLRDRLMSADYSELRVTAEVLAPTG